MRGHLVAFLRDQRYLNSHYAQQIRISHCTAVRGLRRGSDEQLAFPWAVRPGTSLQLDPHHSTIKAHFLPYNGNRRSDPFLQLIEILDRPICALAPDHPEEFPVRRLAVATSIRVQEDLKKGASGFEQTGQTGCHPCVAAPLPALPLGTGSFQWLDQISISGSATITSP